MKTWFLKKSETSCNKNQTSELKIQDNVLAMARKISCSKKTPHTTWRTLRTLWMFPMITSPLVGVWKLSFDVCQDVDVCLSPVRKTLSFPLGRKKWFLSDLGSRGVRSRVQRDLYLITQATSQRRYVCRLWGINF